MKKSQLKKSDCLDLKLRMSPLKPAPVIPVTAPRSVEEYLDFLEEVAPVKPDIVPVKIYKERFRL
jgi:hypothetical protein